MLSSTSNLPLKVILIEDSWLVRQSLGAALGELGGVEIVGEAEDEHYALELLQRSQPDLAIVDLQLHLGSGIGVLQALSSHPDRFGRPRAVVFSNYVQTVVRERCFAFGAEQVFDKNTQMNELLAYVRRALLP
jgi:two-component system, OmpR family, response regulator